MQNSRVCFIGAGNMASALIGGMLKAGWDTDHIIVSDPSVEQQANMRSQFGVMAVSDNAQAVAGCDAVVLAVKPQIMQAVVEPLGAELKDRDVAIVSIAAGVTMDSIKTWLGYDAAIIRTMPNTPSLVSCGAAGLVANDNANSDQRAIAESILRAAGVALWVEKESDIDAVTAVSGSGPAYFFLMLEAMQTAGEKLGLEADTAKLLATQTALGAARMALETGIPAGTLRENVTSPGGTTAAALNVMQEQGLPQIVMDALFAAKSRAEELAKN